MCRIFSSDERRKSDKASGEQRARFPESGNQVWTVLRTKARKVNTGEKTVRTSVMVGVGKMRGSYRKLSPPFHTGAYSNRIWKWEGVCKSHSESLWVFHDSRIRLCFCSLLWPMPSQSDFHASMICAIIWPIWIRQLWFFMARQFRLNRWPKEKPWFFWALRKHRTKKGCQEAIPAL